MFFFGTCCQSYDTGQGFQIRRSNFQKQVQFQFEPNLNKVSKEILENQTNQVIKIKKSQYEEIYNTYKDSNKMWMDQEFLPEKQSIGNIKIQNKWKRISQMVKYPSLFSDGLTPFTILDYNSEQKCQMHSFLYTISVLSQRQDIIKNLFLGQQFCKNGIYKVPLRIDGQIQQILVDDYIPISSNGSPIFSNFLNNQIWLLILQKAWAKVLGSYDKLNGHPMELFKTFSWAPCQQIYIKRTNTDHQKIWQKLSSIQGKNYPVSCQTFSDEEVEFFESGIKPSQIYSLLGSLTLQDKNGASHRIVKIRSLLKQPKYKGKPYENQYIRKKLQERQKQYQNNQFSNKRHNKNENQGIFYIPFQDFCTYFQKLTICMYQTKSNYFSQHLQCNLKNGTIHKFYVKKQGNYNIQTHQPQQKYFKENEQQNCRRGTIVLIKDQNGDLSYVDGVLSLNQKDVLLTAELKPGKYLIYAKFDPNNQITVSNKFSLSIYSRHFTQLIPQQRKAYPDILQRCFLNQGNQDKRTKYNNGLMWISYKILYKQGGYAYIAMGNDATSRKKFVITFDQQDFKKMNFKLKKPFKNQQKIQQLQVLPGQQKIILARAMNIKAITSLKFPPTLGIKMEPVVN